MTLSSFFFCVPLVPITVGSAEKLERSSASAAALQDMGSPGGESVSRLSEYAMLSQHTLLSTTRSPGYPPHRDHDNDEDYGSSSRRYDSSFERPGRENGNESNTSDSSTFSEYMRHFPSQN